jgi:polysaccharide export outer membrane protein
MKFRFDSRWIIYFILTLTITLVFSPASAAQAGESAKLKKVGSSISPSNPNNDVSGAERRVPGTALTDGSADPNFVIGPSDVLAISVWKEPEITRTVTVRRDGKISLPLVGELVASGLTTQQLQQTVTEKLQSYLASPEVTVIVQEARSKSVTVIGQVLKPGSYDLSKSMKVLDVLALSGGFRDFAKVTKIFVVRTTPEGSVQQLKFNYKRVIKGRDLTENIELQPNDTIVVP